MFGKKQKVLEYDRERLTPVIRCSICTGEQTAGFKDTVTGRFEEVMLIRDGKDLAEFKRQYGLGEVPREY